MMKSIAYSAVLALACTAAPVQAAIVDVYDTHTTVGGGAPYADLIGSFTSPSVTFATDTGYDWHPFGAVEFGADITGCLGVELDGLYTFVLDSDDGSLLYIDGGLVVDNGGAHAPAIATGTTLLTAGCTHSRFSSSKISAVPAALTCFSQQVWSTRMTRPAQFPRPRVFSRGVCLA